MNLDWQIVYLSLGSNLGDRQSYLSKALDQLAANLAIKLTAVSSLYETDPVGDTDQDQFYNCVVELKTSLTAWGLLKTCQMIEQELGRQRTRRWGPRTIDIDILFFGSLRQDDPELILPHPRMAERDFVQIPLQEIKEGLIRSTEQVRLVGQDWYKLPC